MALARCGRREGAAFSQVILRLRLILVLRDLSLRPASGIAAALSGEREATG